MAILSMQADFWKFFCYLFQGKGHKTQYRKKPPSSQLAVFNSLESTHVVLHIELLAAFLQFCKQRKEKFSATKSPTRNGPNQHFIHLSFNIYFVLLLVENGTRWRRKQTLKHSNSIYLLSCFPLLALALFKQTCLHFIKIERSCSCSIHGKRMRGKTIVVNSNLVLVCTCKSLTASVAHFSFLYAFESCILCILKSMFVAWFYKPIWHS